MLGQKISTAGLMITMVKLKSIMAKSVAAARQMNRPRHCKPAWMGEAIAGADISITRPFLFQWTIVPWYKPCLPCIIVQKTKNIARPSNCFQKVTKYIKKLNGWISPDLSRWWMISVYHSIFFSTGWTQIFDNLPLSFWHDLLFWYGIHTHTAC